MRASYLSPLALTSLDALRRHLGRLDAKEETEFEAVGTEIINAASVRMNQATARVLRRTNWREPASASVTATANSRTLSGSGLDTVAKVEDDVVGSFIAEGSRVTAVTASTVTLDRDVTAAAASPTAVTFGRRSLRASGSGTGYLRFPEAPVTTIWSAKYEYPNAVGTFTTIDVSKRNLEVKLGSMVIDAAAFPKGEQNIVLEFQGGYAPPTPTELGDEEWFELERLCLRISEVYFDDWRKKRGRSSEFAAGPVSSRIFDFALPTDIQNDLRMWRRP